MSYLTNDFDERVVELLNSGGVGFMPSDTIYGLSAQALSESGVGRLHKVKERSGHKPFIVLISDIKMLDLLSIKETTTQPVHKYWPGALTIICEAPDSPPWLHLGTQTLAVRMPADNELRNLIRKIGPIVSTSANRQGERPINSVAEAEKTFGSQLDFYVDKGKISNEASTIVKLVDGQLRIIRRGTVKIDEKEQVV